MLSWRLLILVFYVSSSSADISHVKGRENYELSYWTAYQKCHDIGSSLALYEDLEDAQNDGYEMCSCGWTAEKKAYFPMTSEKDGCGGGPGVHRCTWQRGNTYNAWCYSGDSIGNCSKPLGMEVGSISDYQMTSTSVETAWWGEKWTAPLARLHQFGTVNAWMPNHNGRNQWIQVDLEEVTAVTGIITQGASRYFRHQYVTSYKIMHSKDGVRWTWLNDPAENTRSAKVFMGNTDNDGLVRNMFPMPILAQHIRVYPHTWEHNICMRLEFLGCDISVYEANVRRIKDIGIKSIGGRKEPRPADTYSVSMKQTN